MLWSSTPQQYRQLVSSNDPCGVVPHLKSLTDNDADAFDLKYRAMGAWEHILLLRLYQLFMVPYVLAFQAII